MNRSLETEQSIAKGWDVSGFGVLRAESHWEVAGGECLWLKSGWHFTVVACTDEITLEETYK